MVQESLRCLGSATACGKQGEQSFVCSACTHFDLHITLRVGLRLIVGTVEILVLSRAPILCKQAQLDPPKGGAQGLNGVRLHTAGTKLPRFWYADLGCCATGKFTVAAAAPAL